MVQRIHSKQVGVLLMMLLDCVLLPTLLLLLQLRPNTRSIDVSAKPVIITDESSSSSCLLHPGTTPCLKPNGAFPVSENVSDTDNLRATLDNVWIRFRPCR